MHTQHKKPTHPNTGRKRKGATFTEYATLLALLSVVAIGALFAMGLSVERSFEESNNSLVGANGNGNGPGGGNNGNGNGNGGNNGGDPSCLNDTSGDDSIVGSGFLNNCVNITTGTDNVDLAGATNGATVHLVGGATPGSATVSGIGTNTTIEIAATRRGVVNVSLGDQGTTIRLNGRNLADLGIARQFTSGRMVFLSLDNGTVDEVFKLAITDMLDPAAYSASGYTIAFDDATVSSAQMYAYALEMTANNVNEYMTPLSDTVEIRCVDPHNVAGNWLTRWYDGSLGDDTFVYNNGSGRVAGGAGTDTLDLSVFAQGDVSYLYEDFQGTVYVMLPDGNNLALPGWGPMGSNLGFRIERIVYSDGVVEEDDAALLWTGPVVRPDQGACAPAVPAGQMGDRIGGPSGPREVEEPMDG